MLRTWKRTRSRTRPSAYDWEVTSQGARNDGQGGEHTFLHRQCGGGKRSGGHTCGRVNHQASSKGYSCKLREYVCNEIGKLSARDETGELGSCCDCDQRSIFIK